MLINYIRFTTTPLQHSKPVMKKLFLLAVLFISAHLTYAQCDKKVTFKCDKGRDFKNGVVDTEMPLESIITIDSVKITLTATLNGQTETLEGEIAEVLLCDWTEFLVNGKTQYKAFIKKVNENQEASLVTITSVNGSTKISLSLISDEGKKVEVDVAEYKITEPEPLPVKEESKKKGRKRKS